MTNRPYYSGKLGGDRLRQCYELASPRVKQYLEAEIFFVVRHLDPANTVLELGCGYGRVALPLAPFADRVIGIDTSFESLLLARQIDVESRCRFLQMDALRLGFADEAFDIVVCVQNGICAFGVDHAELMRETLRVTRRGGRVLFSTYADQFWPDRLKWFEAQAAAGLLGAIDHAASSDGQIVTLDGFRSGRLTPANLQSLCMQVGSRGRIEVVDDSSVFCIITKD